MNNDLRNKFGVPSYASPQAAIVGSMTGHPMGADMDKLKTLAQETKWTAKSQRAKPVRKQRKSK